MRRRSPVPSYRLHKQSGQAVVTFRRPDGTRKDYLLGTYNSSESLAEYERLLGLFRAGLLAAAGGTPADLSVNEVLLAFLEHADRYYRRADGTATNEPNEYRHALKHVKAVAGHRPAREFDVLLLELVRNRMVEAGWCRTRINRQVVRVRTVFRWAASKKLLPAGVVAELDTLPSLRAGRTAARESEPVRPVADADVEAVLPFVRPPVQAMIRLQRHTGMRPGEVCRLTLGQIDRTSDPWTYRPSQHKTLHKGKERLVPIGPKGRAALLDFLADYLPAPDEPVFNPARDREVRYAVWRAKRVSKVPPSQRSRKKAAPVRVPGRWYTPTAYAHAVRKACLAAGVAPWHPGRLRHTAATELRKAFGLDTTRVLLGHSTAAVTTVYAEADAAKALAVAEQWG